MLNRAGQRSFSGAMKNRCWRVYAFIREHDFLSGKLVCVANWLSRCVDKSGYS